MRRKKKDVRYDHLNKEKYKGGVYYDCRFDEKPPETKTKVQKSLERNKEKYLEK